MSTWDSLQSQWAPAIVAGRAAWLSCVCAVLCLSGCGDSEPPMAEPDRARGALKAALEAWKEGMTSESLMAATPPIHVSDSEWHAGNKLVEYELGEERSAGFGWRCDVQLTVQEQNGSTRKHLATYRVDTDPALVVVHEE